MEIKQVFPPIKVDIVMNDKKRDIIDILLIEDNPADVKLLEILLSENVNLDFQYKLYIANTLKEGFKLLEQHLFDVILLDLSLPDSSGFKTISTVYEEITEIPIIVLTGLDDIKGGRKAVKLGAQDFLIKGKVDGNHLVQSIYHSIERQKMIKTIEDLANDLQKEERKLRKIINANADAIIITSNEGKVQFLNPAAEELFECSSNSFKGKEFGYDICENGGKEICIENSTTKYAEVKQVDIEWEGKDAKLLTLRDITKNKQYEQLLKKSERKYRNLFENSPYPILILDSRGNIVDCNSNVLELFEIDKEQFIAGNYKNEFLKPLNEINLFSENLEGLDENNLPDSYELEIKVGEDKKLWLDLNFSFIYLNNIPLIHLLIRNITPIKESEREMRKLEKTLHEMNLLIEHAPMAIFLIYKNGKILRANKAALDLFQYKEESLLNFTVYDLFDQEYQKLIKSHYHKDVFHSDLENQIEARIIRKDGRVKDVEITSTTLKIAGNVIIQSFISDISSRKNYEKNRELLLDQLIQSLEFKSKFLAAMSHDLRTPLNAIIGFSTLLLDESYGKLNENQEDYLHDIYSAAEQLSDLINAMLDISKIEIGGFDLKKKEFNLYPLVKQIHSLFKPLYKKKELFFQIKNLNKAKYIYADPVRFKQILYNLIDNAIKYTEEGGIILRTFEHLDHWEFQIEDTGIGIEKKDYEVVFREFGRIKNDVKKEVSGSGIGLSLTKRLVKLHGGEIWFESEKDKGTIFFFTLPKSKEGRNNANIKTKSEI
ncbi:MAG: PAS domain S-box protein [Candidatus Lokiarchaeota archaeon]|nr:PAS domain S-box protein [Candidatus Lokiarchaeota archaeon]